MITPPLAESGLLFAFQESNAAGKIIILLLFVGSVFSWSVILTKLGSVSAARRMNRRFLKDFRADRRLLRLYELRTPYRGSTLNSVYRAGCRELTFHLLGSPEVDETFAARLDGAERISPTQMRAVNAAMERAVGETSLQLEGKMVLLAMAVSGAPFLGLLGTVWGVMDTFAAIAAAGKASLASMAPGVSGALITTVFGLLVAIPAMFGYNFLLTSLKALVIEMENFSAELSSDIEHRFVDHGHRSHPYVS
jgi:biopolymer transport protein ExbB/TolQ